MPETQTNASNLANVSQYLPSLTIINFQNRFLHPALATADCLLRACWEAVKNVTLCDR